MYEHATVLIRFFIVMHTGYKLVCPHCACGEACSAVTYFDILIASKSGCTACEASQGCLLWHGVPCTLVCRSRFSATWLTLCSGVFLAVHVPHSLQYEQHCCVVALSSLYSNDEWPARNSLHHQQMVKSSGNYPLHTYRSIFSWCSLLFHSVYLKTEQIMYIVDECSIFTACVLWITFGFC